MKAYALSILTAVLLLPAMAANVVLDGPQAVWETANEANALFYNARIESTASGWYDELDALFNKLNDRSQRYIDGRWKIWALNNLDGIFGRHRFELALHLIFDAHPVQQAYKIHTACALAREGNGLGREQGVFKCLDR